jgi:hypothetical protein
MQSKLQVSWTHCARQGRGEHRGDDSVQREGAYVANRRKLIRKVSAARFRSIKIRFDGEANCERAVARAALASVPRRSAAVEFKVQLFTSAAHDAVAVAPPQRSAHARDTLVCAQDEAGSAPSVVVAVQVQMRTWHALEQADVKADPARARWR